MSGSTDSAAGSAAAANLSVFDNRFAVMVPRRDNC
jgi:hypothetical protein